MPPNTCCVRFDYIGRSRVNKWLCLFCFDYLQITAATTHLSLSSSSKFQKFEEVSCWIAVLVFTVALVVYMQ